MRAARRSTASRPVHFKPITDHWAGIRVRASRWTFNGFVKKARNQQAEEWAEHQRQRDEEERQSRVMVITEFDAASAKEIGVLRGHESLVHSAAFSPDGSRIVTASYDGTARIWDAASA